MNRLEIIYTVIANMIKVLSQADTALIPDSCKHYLEENDKSKQLYRQKKEQVDSKLEQLLDESLELFDAVSENLKKPKLSKT